MGVEVGAGGIAQSFLDSNKFPDADPALGHGVPSQVGISSSAGAEEPPWGGFPWNFPFAKFIMVMGMVSSAMIWVSFLYLK